MTTDDLRHEITRDVNTTLEAKLSELRAYQEQMEAEKDKKRKEEEAARKKVQDDAVSQLLQLQVKEAEERAKRQGLWNKILAALAVILTGVAGTVGVVATRAPTPEQKEQEAAPVIERVEQEGAQIEKRIKANEDKVERLKDLALEQQVQISDSSEYIVKKIDAAHPRTADDVERPKTMDAANTKADAIKKKRASEQREAIEAEVDPFAGLE